MTSEKLGGGMETGTCTANSTYASGGSLKWYKWGRIVMVIIDGLNVTTAVPMSSYLFEGLPTTSKNPTFRFGFGASTASINYRFYISGDKFKPTGSASGTGYFYATFCYLADA